MSRWSLPWCQGNITVYLLSVTASVEPHVWLRKQTQHFFGKTRQPLSRWQASHHKWWNACDMSHICAGMYSNACTDEGGPWTTERCASNQCRDLVLCYHSNNLIHAITQTSSQIQVMLVVLWDQFAWYPFCGQCQWASTWLHVSISESISNSLCFYWCLSKVSADRDQNWRHAKWIAQFILQIIECHYQTIKIHFMVTWCPKSDGIKEDQQIHLLYWLGN